MEPVLLRLKDAQEIQDRYPLASYAAKNWPDHFRDSDRKVCLGDQVLQMFRDVESSFNTWVTIWDVDNSNSKRNTWTEVRSPI